MPPHLAINIDFNNDTKSLNQINTYYKRYPILDPNFITTPDSKPLTSPPIIESQVQFN